MIVYNIIAKWNLKFKFLNIDYIHVRRIVNKQLLDLIQYVSSGWYNFSLYNSNFLFTPLIFHIKDKLSET